MPDYKRKKVKKSFTHKKTRVNASQNILMTNKKEKNIGIVPENDIRVVRGAKYKNKQKTKFFVSVLAFVCLICIVLSLVLPVGLYENIVNATALIGHGSYPIDISGSTVLNSTSCGQYYYVLTDTNISSYSNNGKIILNELHGFANPIMSVSDTRVLVYDQGGKVAYVYNLSGKIHTIEAEEEIITASISRDGTFAVATHSDSYTSVVTVYDKNAKQVFAWNSAKDVINNVLVNPAGNKLAVTTLGAVSGQYISKLLILNFESADPLHTVELGSSLALSLVNTGKGISVVCADKYKFIHWSKFTSGEVAVEGEINLFRSSKNGVLLTFNRANNRSDNTVVLISNKGEKISDFKLQSNIIDIQYNKGRVYLVSDKTVNIYDKNGNKLRYDNCEYGVNKISVISSNAIATITDSEIIKNDIEKGED